MGLPESGTGRSPSLPLSLSPSLSLSLSLSHAPSQYQHNQGEGFCKWFHAEAVAPPPGEEEAKDGEEQGAGPSVTDFCRRAFREEGFLDGIARCNASGVPLVGAGAAERGSDEGIDAATDKAFEALSAFSMAIEGVEKYRGQEVGRWGAPFAQDSWNRGGGGANSPAALPIEAQILAANGAFFAAVGA